MDQGKPPRSLTRVSEIQAKMELGKTLLDLKATSRSNCHFGRLVREHFDVDQAGATETMRAWRTSMVAAGKSPRAFPGTR
ncbi:hypothetical protein GCM10007857_44680 [Bradyrhizobium iriomotense]|uniref:Uncharacterized protein n=1 Tax=Bradyrhizobium iriomotense TaxID=441950 RepID=A0ABQ6AZY7_9BRAD|nr:hypothetical protein GCM10007857_44680 [Bradyrhizobium iriomotense]